MMHNTHQVVDVLNLMRFYNEELELTIRDHRIFALKNDGDIKVSYNHRDFFHECGWEIVDDQWSIYIP